MLAGPGKISAALGVDLRFSGASLTHRAGLFVADQPRPERFLVGPRVGIDYAEPEHRAAPWRLALPDTRWVSQRATLRPWDGTLAAFLASQRPAPHQRQASGPPKINSAR
jgi:DNA-3-methyladenine glycosylase